MNCTEFRGLYSDFVDGILDEMGEIAARRHLGECLPCRRFHETVCRGVDELRHQPQVLPSAGFGVRLQRRIKAEAAPLELAMRQGSAAAVMLMGLTVVAAGLFAFDLARHSVPAPVKAGELGPLPVLGANAFKPTFRYVTHSVTTTAPFATAAQAADDYRRDAYAAPAVLIGGTEVR